MSYFPGAIQVLDQDGVARSVQVETSSQGSYLHIIAETHGEAVAGGLEPYHHVFRILGYQAAVPTGGITASVDLWGSAAASTYVFPATAMQMKVLAGNAQDAGSAAYTGTATGGSTTTLIDTGKNFTTLPVVAGDVILVQFGNVVAIGIVSVVAATTLTVSPAFTDGVTSPSGYTYTVIDRSAGGTGVQAVAVHYLNANYQEKETYMVLAGASPVSTVPTDILRVNDMHSLCTGKTVIGGGAAAPIYIADQATGAIIYRTILTTFNKSIDAIWTVPASDPNGRALSAAYMTGWQASSIKGTGTPVGYLRLRVTSDEDGILPVGTWQQKDQMLLMNGTASSIFDPPIKVPSRTDMKITGCSDTAATIQSGHFEGWYE